MRLPLTATLLCALPAMALAQASPIHTVCALTVLCPDTGECRDWDQQITISGGAPDAAWEVVWNTELPSDYELVADYTPPEGAVEQVRVISLLYRNEATQTSQLITFEDAENGTVVVTGHQPQAGLRVVSGLGTCEATE
jgi:hypothetical protein